MQFETITNFGGAATDATPLAYGPCAKLKTHTAVHNFSMMEISGANLKPVGIDGVMD